MPKNQYISTTEAAKTLGISRIAVFKRIQQGKLKAVKNGRNFVIDKNEVKSPALGLMSPAVGREIEAAIAKTVQDYGETLKLLGSQ
ncbi:MAG: excisionase family DNA-binding protein [Patescibacteria group bacterium]|jgi:excisionase family DNA binding protein